MFSDCVLLAMLETKDKSIKLRRIVEDRTAQQATNTTFSQAAEELTKDRTAVVFDGKYHPQPEDMEYLVIAGYTLPDAIKEAIHNPQGLELYVPEDGKFPPIKALLVGKCEKKEGEDAYTVAFQKFKQHQYITAAKHHIFFTGETYVTDTRQGISIARSVDCVYNDSKLVFRSYYYARQIVDLSEYYRIASNQDVQNFVGSPIMFMDNGDEFVVAANSWERRKIAAINDAGTLTRFTAMEIKSKAQKSGVQIRVSGGKMILPTDKTERRVVLAFLDEEVYKGPFTEQVFQTNSKKVAHQ